MESLFWTQSLSEVALSFKTDLSNGLSRDEGEKRLREYGENTLPKKGRFVWWKLLLGQFSSLIIWLLIGAAIVAGLLGEVIDAWAIVAIVLLNAILGFVQEFRAESSLEALQELSAPISKVIRGGVLQMIPSKEVVPGDLLLLEAGDRIPADGRIVDHAHLTVEEASLTGESVPVAKSEKVMEGAELPLGDRRNMVYMGTVVVSGKGHVVVTQTGIGTEMGKIASELLQLEKEETPLQRRLNILGKRLVYGCLAIVAIVFGLGVLRGSGVVEMLLVALSLAVAAIPEGLPAAVTITLSIGVRKMAEKKALIRRLSSVETLGSTNVICSDKTGTLTQNAMTVGAIYVDREMVEVTGTGYTPEGEFSKKTPNLEHALQIGVLCNNANILQEEGVWKVAGDPTEGALLTAAAKAGLWKKDLEKGYHFIEEIPFDSERKMMSVLRKDNGNRTLFVKGAPDVLLSCSKHWLVDGKEILIGDKEREEIAHAQESLASKAYRVLGVAYQTNLEAKPEEDLVFVGLIAMIDPPREEVKEAIALCKLAGIRTIMVTGDHKATAVAIANELDMNAGEVAEGALIGKMNDEELEKVAIFSRISPEHKLKIVKAYQGHDQVVAMTGDGVNDAPAVQAADIGVSMGITGTDVTKEASDMILLDDNFASIVQAVKQGRGIYDNIVKFVGYLLAANVAEVLVIFIAMLIGLTANDGSPFIPLLPVQLLWLNLVTDGFPAISLALDPIDPDAMKKPPRPRHEAILNKRFSLYLFSLSALITIGALIAAVLGLKTSAQMGHTLTFTTLVVLELVKVQLVRIPTQMRLFSNKYLIIAVASSFLLQLAAIYIPFLQPVFGTSVLGLSQWGIIALMAVVFYGCGRLLAKFFYNSRS